MPDIFLLKIFLVRFAIYNNSIKCFLVFENNLGKLSSFFQKFQLRILCSYFNLRRESNYAHNCIGKKIRLVTFGLSFIIIYLDLFKTIYFFYDDNKTKLDFILGY